MRFPKSWLDVRLTDICELNPRLTKDERPNEDTMVTFVPMAAVDENQGIIAQPEIRSLAEVAKGYTSFRENDVLFAKVTPCMENGKAAIARNLSSGLGFGSTEFHVLRPNAAILPEYLFSFVRQKAFRDRAASAFVGTGGLQRVPLDFLSRVKVPLPTLPEQQHIVDVLQHAKSTTNQQHRRTQLDEIIKSALDSLVYAIPEANWEKLSPLVETRYGTSVSANSTAELGTAVLRIPNVMGGEVDTLDLKYVDLPERDLSRLRLSTDDVLIVRSNGNPNYVGRCAPITEDLANSTMVYASYLIRLRTNKKHIRPEYLSAFLNSSFGRAAMRNAIRTTAGQSNLSAESLIKIRLPVPSIDEQLRFSKIWHQVRRLRSLISKSEGIANDLLDSLTIEAFSGNLTRSWRESNKEEVDKSLLSQRTFLHERDTKNINVRSLISTKNLTHLEAKDEGKRSWIKKEISNFQRHVLICFTDYCQNHQQPLIVEDPEIFTQFLDDDSVLERLEQFGESLGNRVRRTLSQLASLGLIAKITLPKQSTETDEIEYLKAFRPLRAEEFTRMSDVQQLRKVLSSSVENTLYFQVSLDYETSSSAGAAGMFQVISVIDSSGKHITDRIDQGQHYASLEDLKSDIADELGVNRKLIELKVE
ncbi:restriction endonuclease subunit S [Vibrio alginolyticus]|uniref:restriction endonuclease subunit S n=1 Tax=Vibrio alginolyticus TaxID=663 RepID=UPI0014283E05|nr:restriction endonuclease subunit S [Vibrio alginolyticus]QIR94364.1 restriction endonuclease subunit S [Vibrio alginolyticus]